jgi:hypothetical protein
MKLTYLTTEELSQRIKYEPCTIRNQLKDSTLLEGIHYFRPFQGRKILYIWERVEERMLQDADSSVYAIPMANGGVANGH